MLFLDIKKAYDTVFREGRLWEAGFKGKMWRVLKNIYTQGRKQCYSQREARRVV